MDNSMQGKSVLVTGGTNGIGLVTARELSRLGGTITLIGRNADKCSRVAAAISSDTGYPVEFIVADLSTLTGVSLAAADYKQKHTRLDVLVNNAGAVFFQRKLTSDGFERTFALNHLNYFLLTNLLLDLLKASVPARIVNVSSGAHTGAESMDFDNLQGEKRFAGMAAYSQSKLANLLFTYELARRLKGSGVTVNALHPGYVDTGFAQNNGPLFKVGAKLSGRIFGRTPEEGASTSIYLASSPQVEGISGQYFIDCKLAESSPASHDTAAAERLWQVSLELTKKQLDNLE
jgi:retinol dehydrogenase 14